MMFHVPAGEQFPTARPKLFRLPSHYKVEKSGRWWCQGKDDRGQPLYGWGDTAEEAYARWLEHKGIRDRLNK